MRSLCRSRRKRGVVGKEIDERRAAQLLLAFTHQVGERLVHLLDDAVAVAHHQHVGHRGEHAEDELLRLLQLGVLLLQRHLVLQEIRVHLIHLADDVDPDVLADALRRMVEGVRRQGRQVDLRLLAFAFVGARHQDFGRLCTW